MFEPNAKIIADSISPGGKRLVTLECEMHRFVLAEFNTHRVFSRNSASSRAIPYQKMRAKALENTAFPVSWPAEQKGMQGGEELSTELQIFARNTWREAVLSAVHYTDQLHEKGVHKSVINRLLEPFIPHKAIVSATEWDGFFEQRLHPDAQPEIHQLAIAMKAVMDESTPTQLADNEWHMPYAPDKGEIYHSFWEDKFESPNEAMRAVSVARCARVSYETHDGVRDVEKDYELYFRLKDHKPAHASPFEHVATPRSDILIPQGNFKGWTQLRGILGL
jgi:thymidylate synthase ThyX